MLNTASQVSSLPLAARTIGVIAGNVNLVAQNKSFDTCLGIVSSIVPVSLKESLMTDDTDKSSKFSKPDSKKHSKTTNIELNHIEDSQAQKNTGQPSHPGKSRQGVQYSEVVAGVSQPYKNSENYNYPSTKLSPHLSWTKRNDAHTNKSDAINGANSDHGKQGTTRHQSTGTDTPRMNWYYHQKNIGDQTFNSPAFPRHASNNPSHPSYISNGPVVSSIRSDHPSGRPQEEKKKKLPVNVLPTDSSNPCYSQEWPELDFSKNTSSYNQDSEKENKNISNENSSKTHSDDNQNQSTGTKKISWSKIEVQLDPHHMNSKRSYNYEHTSSQGKRSDSRYRNSQISKSSRKLAQSADSRFNNSHISYSTQKTDQGRSNDGSDNNTHKDKKGTVNFHNVDSFERSQLKKSINTDGGGRRMSANTSAIQQDRSGANFINTDSHLHADNSSKKGHFDSFSKSPSRHKFKQSGDDQELGNDSKGLDQTAQHHNVKGRSSQNYRNSHNYQVGNNKLKGVGPGWTKYKKNQRRVNYNHFGGPVCDGFLDLSQHRHAPVTHDTVPQVNVVNYYQFYRTSPHVKSYNRQVYPPIEHMVHHSLDVTGFDQIKQLICRQVEYYFSVDNLCKDTYFRENMNPENGSVPLYFVSQFNRMTALISMAAIRVSQILSLSLKNNNNNIGDTENQDQTMNPQQPQNPDLSGRLIDPLIELVMLSGYQALASPEWVQSLIISSLSESKVVEVLLNDNERTAYLRPMKDWERWILQAPSDPLPNNSPMPALEPNK